MSESKIHEIFTTILPSVEAGKRMAFLAGMRAYHEKFMGWRVGMHYEADEQYQNEWFEIAVVDQNDYWLYSPQFIKIMGLVLNELFKTRIQYHSLPDPTVIDRDCALIDRLTNRWVVSLRTPENEPEKMRICMRMPRSVTQMCTCGMASENEVSAVNPTVQIRVTDTRAWYD